MITRQLAAIRARSSVPQRLIALIEQGQEMERRGHSEEARALYEHVLQSGGCAVGGAVVSDLTRWIGRTYVADGDLSAAADVTEAALAIAEALGDMRSVAAALNAMGSIHQIQGDLDQAVFYYKRAEVVAKQTGDVMLGAMTQHNLAIIANIQGELEVALSHYRDCVAGFRAVRLDEHVVYVLNNLGMLFVDLGRWADAEQALTEALDVCDRHESIGNKAVILVNLVKVLGATGRWGEAEKACEAASVLQSQLSDERARGELSRMHGIVLRELGEMERADRQFRAAGAIAEERGDVLLAAEVLREQAVLFSLQERHREALQCLNRSHQHFSRLRARSDVAGLDRSLQQLENAFLAVVARWGESIESADRYTQGHCLRVAEYAGALARAVGVDERALLWFRLGALLHDIGKMVVPPEVLNKAGGYTPEERQLMERHPDAGVELLAGIEFPWDIRPMIQFHHERWSGGGYPTGVSGEAIPLAARILCIAEVFDALSTDRPYRRALPLEDCLEIMCNSMRGHFDPDLLEAFVELCRSAVIAPPQPAPTPARHATAPGGEEVGVLLLSDHFSSWEMETLARSWSGSGLHFTIVHPLESAPQLLGTGDFSATLLLLDGGRMDPTASVVRARELCSDLPLLAVIEQNDEDLALRVIQEGAQEVLVRRFVEPEMLERHVRRSMERLRLQRELQSQSLHDHLTGLYNRRGFLSVATRRLKATRWQEQRPALLFIDVDGLKQINDRAGHAEGDRALIKVATALRAAFRETDVVGRLGGDEFVVFSHQPVAVSVPRLVRRITDEIAARDPRLEQGLELSVSVGVALGVADAKQTIDELLELADRSMYQMKRHQDEPEPSPHVSGAA